MRKVFLFLFHFSFLVFSMILGFIYVIQAILSNGYAELLSHFTILFFFISLIYLFVFLVLKNKILIFGAFSACLLTAYPWVGLIIPPSIFYENKVIKSQEEISILSINIYYRNNKVEPLIRYIKEKKYPDIVLVQEATPYMVYQLRSLNNHYPYVFAAPERHPFGMMILSRIPIVQFQRKHLESTGNQYSLIDFKTIKENTLFTLVELHTFSPIRDVQMTERRQELEEIAHIITQLPSEHKMLIGDLNTTPFSPYFRKLLKTTGLSNSMKGLRIQGTWHSQLPIFLRIPIDHVLISEQMRTTDQQIGPDVGSDHLPIFTQLLLGTVSK